VFGRADHSHLFGVLRLTRGMNALLLVAHLFDAVAPGAVRALLVIP
jgi:hypothetical protein